jgi:hypothetical protein
MKFEEFKSSQYNKLAEKIYKECFEEDWFFDTTPLR